MAETVIISISITGSLIYYYYLYLSWRGYRKSQNGLIVRINRVSIVIAMRNEKHHIRELLTRLANQNYSDDAYEVIIADDGSDDGSSEIVERYQKKWKNIRLLKVDRPDGIISGKKNALQKAIQKANGEIILVTDADCQPGSNWIRTMVSCFDKDTDMVAGVSRTELERNYNILSAKWYEHFDFMAMFAVAGGLIMSDKYFSCSAQNLGFRKSSWEKVGGYTKIMHLESGDDVNLMQLFRKAGMSVRFNLVHGSFMTTRAIDSWQALINQRSRWASNTRFQFKLNPEFFIYLISVLICTFFPFILLFINIRVGLILLAIRLILEINFVYHTFYKLQAEDRLWMGYPVWMIMQPFYMIIVAIRGIFSHYSWK